MNVALQVFTAAQALEKTAQRIFKPHGLTPAHFNVLKLLSDQPDGMRASDLARALIVDPSNVTGLLKRMKKDGLLREIENAKDRRQHVVAMSVKGRTLWKEATVDYERCLAAFDACITRANQSVAEKVLQQLVAASASLP